MARTAGASAVSNMRRTLPTADAMTAVITRLLRPLVLLATVACSARSQPATRPGAESRLFAMQSNFWVNLHHFLYVSARARKGLDSTRPSVTQSLGDTAGFGALSAARQAEWDEALDYYGRALAERDILFDSALVLANMRLSQIDS